jgi:hypothetical protein
MKNTTKIFEEDFIKIEFCYKMGFRMIQLKGNKKGRFNRYRNLSLVFQWNLFFLPLYFHNKKIPCYDDSDIGRKLFLKSKKNI